MGDDPPEMDLDFVRYAEDIKESKSLKKFIESSRDRTRSRPRTPQLNVTGGGDGPSTLSRSHQRVGPEGCERPHTTSICASAVRKEIYNEYKPSPARLWIESPTPSNASSENCEMGFVREKMHDALGRLRDLEEQVKTIPKLQVQISILEQQRAQLQRDLTREKEKTRDMDRSADSVRDQWISNEKKLKIENEALLGHVKQLECIVDKVNCEVRSIAAQTDFSCLKRTSRHTLHIEEDHDSSDSSTLSDISSKRRRRKPTTRSVASGGFEYLDNVICYDRTTLRSVGIGTSTTYRDFGNTVNMRTDKQFWNKVDRAVGNHAEFRSVGSHARPETREKRLGRSRPAATDASTGSSSPLMQNKSIHCDLIPPAEPIADPEPVIIIEKVELPPVKPQTTDVSVWTSISTSDMISGPDVASHVDASTYANWFAENSRARRVQTTSVATRATSIETDSLEYCETGTDACEELSVSLGTMTTTTAETFPLKTETGNPSEPRTLDLDDDEILMIFGNKKEPDLVDTNCGPDETIKEQTFNIVREFTSNNPDIVEELLHSKLLAPETDDDVTPTQSEADDSKGELTEAEMSDIYEPPVEKVLPKPDFGTEEYPLMTDIEETYELPEGLPEQVIVMEKLLKAGDEALDPPKELKREWFNITSKPHSRPQSIEDFITAIKEVGPNVLPMIANCYDVNGNCALHYAVSHGNLHVVQQLVRCDHVDVNLSNKAGYTPVMLAALVDTSDKPDLTPLMRLFQRAELNLKSKKEYQTALMLAASHGRRDTVRLLLMNNCEVDEQDEEGSSALMCASEHGHVDIVRLLLDMPSCDPNLEDNDGATALAIAMENGHRDIGVLLYAKMNFEE